MTMQTTQIPPVPGTAPVPQAPKPKRWKKIVIGSLAVIGGLTIISGLSGSDPSATGATGATGSRVEKPAPQEPKAQSWKDYKQHMVEPTTDVTAEDVVTAMGPTQVKAFCSAQDLLEATTSSNAIRIGYVNFRKGYGATKDPSAREVYVELLSRC